jgi:uncharacterized RmlC-like cupin family protein
MSALSVLYQHNVNASRALWRSNLIQQERIASGKTQMRSATLAPHARAGVTNKS